MLGRNKSRTEDRSVAGVQDENPASVRIKQMAQSVPEQALRRPDKIRQDERQEGWVGRRAPHRSVGYSDKGGDGERSDGGMV